MALEPASDPLRRATDAARDEPADGWAEVSASIMARVRTLVVPADPVVVHTATGTLAADGSRTSVSSRVVVDVLRRLLQSGPTHAPAGIDLRLTDDDRLGAVELRLVGAYGVDLVALAARVRADVVAALVEIVGPDPDLGPGTVSIEFVDVVDGDPNLV